METESNNNKTTFSLYKQEQATIIPMTMTKCVIAGCPAITDSLIRFPPKHTKEYTFWLRACKESEANIIFKQNPMVCVLHFRDSDKMPIRYVTKKDIDILHDDLDRVNHCVAEWLLFMRKNAPTKVIDDKDVYSKAKEIGKIYLLPHFEFDVDFGWIHIFEKYVHSKGIESWKPESNKYQKDLQENEKVQSEESIADGAYTYAEADGTDTDTDAASESIKTYDEALKRVKILYSYCKRTKNKSALEIIERLNKVLKKRV